MMLGGETGEKLLRKGNLLVVAKEYQNVVWIPQKMKHQSKWGLDLVEVYWILWLKTCKDEWEGCKKWSSALITFSGIVQEFWS